MTLVGQQRRVTADPRGNRYSRPAAGADAVIGCAQVDHDAVIELEAEAELDAAAHILRAGQGAAQIDGEVGGIEVPDQMRANARSMALPLGRMKR